MYRWQAHNALQQLQSRFATGSTFHGRYERAPLLAWSSVFAESAAVSQVVVDSNSAEVLTLTVLHWLLVRDQLIKDFTVLQAFCIACVWVGGAGLLQWQIILRISW